MSADVYLIYLYLSTKVFLNEIHKLGHSAGCDCLAAGKFLSEKVISSSMCHANKCLHFVTLSLFWATLKP